MLFKTPHWLRKINEKLLFPMIKLGSPNLVYNHLKRARLDLNSFGESEYNTNPLIYALYYKKYETAKVLISFGADVNAYWNGLTVLESCIATKDKKTIEFLIENGVDLHSEACKKLNPISIAVRAGAMQIAWLLNGSGVDVNQPSLDGKTPLHVSAENRDDLYGRNTYFLLQMGADPRIKDNFGRTPLLCAALESCVEHARQLYDDKRTDINACDDFGTTALMIASERGAIGMVRDLLNNPAKPDPNASNIHGHTPLSLAFSEEICDELIKAGAKINHLNEKGESPLYIAVRIGKERTVQFLLDRGADVNVESKLAISPLNSAVLGHTLSTRGIPNIPPAYTYEHSINLLCAHPDIDLNKYGALSATPLIFAMQLGNTRMANTLIDKGCDINKPHQNKNEPIVYAVYLNDMPLVEKLLAKGANPCANVYDLEEERQEPVKTLIGLAEEVFPQAVPTLTQAVLEQRETNGKTQAQQSALKAKIAPSHQAERQ